MKILNKESVIIVALALLYILTAPYTVQSGDTGELVTNSYFLRVIHPPGYPLWTLLYHLPVKYLPLQTPFFSAAVLTIFISLTWLSLLLFKFKDFSSQSIVLITATSVFFWRYAVLPDVFSLHLLFLTLIFLVFMEADWLQKPWVIFLVSLSVAHHHTIVFAFPLFAYALFESIQFKKKMLFSVLFGFLSFGLYFILISFHPKDYGSWNNLNHVQDVWNHFLRSEYGTFRLHANNSGADTIWLRFILTSVLANCWGMLVLLSYILIKAKQLVYIEIKKLSILLFSLLSYIITFYLTGVISPDGFGEGVLERFLLQPTLFLVFITLFLIKRSNLKIPKWIELLLVVNILLNLGQNFKANDYRNNTVIEDFAINALNSLPEKSIYYTYGDTQGFATYYVHDLLKIRPDIIHLQPTLKFSWSANKAQEKFPDALRFVNGNILDAVNTKKYSFFMNVPPLEHAKEVKLTYWGILYHLEKEDYDKGTLHFECKAPQEFKWRTRPALDDFIHFESSRFYDLEYGRCNYAEGLSLFSQNEYLKASKSFEAAVMLSPHSVRYQERLCFTYKALHNSGLPFCLEKLDELISISDQQYYFYKY